MNRHTEDHESEPHETEAFTQPDVHQPYDSEWEWGLWLVAFTIGLALSYGVIKLIPILGGILSWQ